MSDAMSEPTTPVPAEPEQDQPTGLAEPGSGPEHHGRMRASEAPTRSKAQLYDRLKFSIGILVVLIILALANMRTATTVLGAEQIRLPFADTLDETLARYRWLLWLLGFEVLRQVHYLVSEHWSAYHRFWRDRVFGGWNRRLDGMNDWTRYRMGRVVKWVVRLVALDLILAAFVPGATPANALFLAPSLVFQALPQLFQLAFAFFFIAFQFIGLFWLLSRGGTETYFPDDIETRFTDVWGQDRVLEKVRENMIFLEDPESIEDKGGYVPGGILLWGPPGTGKTLMAEAVAGETGKPYIFVEPGAFTNMFFGVGILKVKSLFRKARKLALRYGGVILFMDEADALGNRGALASGGPPGRRFTPDHPFSAASCNGLSYLTPDTTQLLLRQAMGPSAVDAPSGLRERFMMGAGMGGGGGMGTLQALLTEISGLKKPRGFVNRYVRRALGMRPKPPPKYRILIMMASNMPEALDEALLRPGRIDRIYKVGYPSKEGRIRTYNGYLEKVSHRLTEEEIERLSTITPYATGATIKDMVNEALINTIRRGADAIEWQDIVKAKHLKELGPPEDVEYIERERHAVAVHEACHAVVAYRVRHHLTIDIATIEKGGTYLGMVASIPPEDQFTRWRSEYESDIMVSLASLAGERMFFDGDNSSGVSGDLHSATSVATLMEGFWGMGSTIASFGAQKQIGVPGGGGGGKPGSDEDEKAELLRGNLGERIESNLAELYERTWDLLEAERATVLSVAHVLETHKTVTGQDLAAVIDGIEGPLIDGRPYRDEVFHEELERYHEQARSAHEEHGPVLVPLPRVRDVVPASASAYEAGVAPDQLAGATTDDD